MGSVFGGQIYSKNCRARRESPRQQLDGRSPEMSRFAIFQEQEGALQLQERDAAIENLHHESLRSLMQIRRAARQNLQIQQVSKFLLIKLHLPFRTD